MRVQYTIPGWEPVAAAAGSAAPEAFNVFETRFREASAVAPPPSMQILGLNRPRPGELALAPPQRPASLAFSDIDEDRRLCHNLLSRHQEQPPEDASAYQMLVLMAELQRSEDDLMARSLVDPRLNMQTNWTDEEIYLISQRAYELATQGRYELAAVLFEGLLAVAPGNGYARRALAAVRIQSGDAASALKALDGLAAAERDARARQLRLDALFALGRFKEAGAELTAARPYLDARTARRFALCIEYGRTKQLSGRQPDN